MENLSNNNNRANNSGSLLRLLLLFVFSCSFFSAKAQPYFNRLYTNSATGSIFQAVCAQGSAGGFMAVVLANDSVEAKEGIRVSRMDASGQIQSSSFIIQPEYTFCSLYPRQGAICKVNENSFAILGDLNFPDGRGNYAFILLVDSNGILQKFKGYVNPYPSATDSLLLPKAIAFDGKSIIVLGNITEFKSATKQLLVKFDTALNVLWEKTYTEGRHVRKLTYSLHADSTGYVMGGFSDNGIPFSDTKSYLSETFVVHTDTSGTALWRYLSPKMACAAADIVRTADGGYVYSTMSNVIDTWPIKTDSRAEWRAQELLVKLDSDGVWQWEKVYDYKPSYPSSFGITTIRLLTQGDGGYRTMRIYSDSPGSIDKIAYADLRLYSDTGALIWRHKYAAPVDTPARALAAFYDFVQTSDKGIVMAGYYDNRLTTASAPAQRGWLVKVDSNGCMGADDPQCWGVRIPDVTLNTAGFTVYPNPSNGLVTIKSLQGQQQDIQVKVYDLLGRVVHQQKLSFFNNEAQIHIDATKGMYILELSNDVGNLWRERLLVE